MKIAVTTQGDQIFQHFGQCKVFTVYDIGNGAIKEKKTLDTGGNGHAALAGFLKDAGVNVLFCGGIGDGAKRMLASADIELISGLEGKIDNAVRMYLEGGLADQGGSCTHEAHGQDHSCNCKNHCD